MDSRRQAPPSATQHHPPRSPPPPLASLAIASDRSSRDCPGVDQVLWLGKGAKGRVGLWERDAAQALFADAPEVPSSPPPPTCPYHRIFLWRPATADAVAVVEVAEHSVLFFAGMVRQMEVTEDGTVDEGEAINFATSGVPPPPSGPPGCGTWGTPPQPGKAASAACRGLVHPLPM